MRRLALTTVCLLVGAVGTVPARADWTTYRGDGARSGIDASSQGSVPFAAAWTSPTLGGSVWSEPLVYHGLVIVATESNDVYALSESTGQVVWHVNAGTPVPSGQLPCGDISPTVGITSTPVIDPTTGRVFVVADTWNGSSPQHRLFGWSVADGSSAPGLPVAVDPSESDPTTQLQRPALALTDGRVIIGYGGNDGDCGSYHGWLVSVPETGGGLSSFEVDASGNGGAVWGAGSGPAVDGTGDVWAATGNGDASSYGYQESVLKLDPAVNLLDSWAPSNWPYLDNNDVDLGSSQPLLLPGGLVFQIGKEGVGDLLSAAPLSLVFSAQVCAGSFGGAVYYSGVIYVACSDGLHALSLDTAARRFSALAGWQVHSSAIGPPIVSGGLVWATGWDSQQLFGLDPQTGRAVVDQSTPSMEHFATPAASDGTLFLATGRTLEAYHIANAAPPAPPPPSPGGVVGSAPQVAASGGPAVLGSTQARVAGIVVPDGLATTAHFEYGLDGRYRAARTTTYDRSTPSLAVGSDSTGHSVSAVLSGLVPNAVYHVRLVAGNGAGTSYGPDQTFTTARDRPPRRPALGRTVNLKPVSGLILVRVGGAFVPLTEARKLPLGVVVDARRGAFELIAAGPRLQTGTFRGGELRLSQARSGPARGLTTLALIATGVPACKASHIVQTLRARARGRFAVRGRYAGSVGGRADWTTTERCTSTTLVVRRGAITVTSSTRHLRFTVGAGHNYVARRP